MKRDKIIPKDLKTLIAMQLKDKLDLGFISDKKLLIRKIIFFIFRFILVGGVAFGLFFVASFLKIFHNSPFLPTSLMTIILTIILFISIVTSTIELTNSLYLAKDNAVLVTYPVNLNKVFLSKIIVYYLYELNKNFSFTLPIFIAFGLMSPVSPFFYFWIWIAFLVVTLIPVVLGVVLSIPFFYLSLFLKRTRFIKTAVFITLLGSFIYLLVILIDLIPSQINILFFWGPIKVLLSDISIFFQKYFVGIYFVVVMIFGKLNIKMEYSFLTWQPWLAFFGTIFLLSALFFIAYYLSRFIFLKMISQGDSYEKQIRTKAFLNVPHTRFTSFLIKEIKLLFRNGEFAYNFLATYISVPLIIFLINKIFGAMDLSVGGLFFVQAFNILLILLPLLSSNGLIATMYSKEARTAYIKRTKPVKAFMPLFIKLIPNLVLSIISLVVSMLVFNIFMEFRFINLFFLTSALVFLQVGHLLLSALFDLMNPQNEQYATTGEHIQNPNETKSIGSAFAISFLFTLIMLFFTLEAVSDPIVKFNIAFLKLFMIALVFVGIIFYLFVENIKAFYYKKVES